MPETDKSHLFKTCCFQQDIFSLLEQHELELIDKNKHEASFKPGEIIMQQGTELTHIACITKGYGKIYIEGINNKNLIIKIFQQNEMIGGPGMYTDFMMHYSVSALTEVTSCLIEARTLYEIVKSNSKFALRILKHINSMSIYNFKKFINLTQKQMHGRIADAIFYLANVIHKSDDFETPISRHDLAEMTAMTKESAIRILKDLKDNNTISVEGNHFKILNREALQKISKTG